MVSMVNSNKNNYIIVIKSEFPATLEKTSKMMEFTSLLCFAGIEANSRKEGKVTAIDEENTSHWILRLHLLSGPGILGPLPQLDPFLSEFSF